MIKFYISYFYQIRHMKPNMLPMSTAMYDPKWFHNDKGNSFFYFDKNHVLNGVRCPELCMNKILVDELISDGTMCSELCPKDLDTCPFMEKYYNFIRTRNPSFDKFISHLDWFVLRLNKFLNINIDTVVFIVHEPPSVKCSERPILIKWFEENDIELEEYKPC